ncbi:MAG: hypothetical protein KA248_03705, partial [Kiritimatiellae bacterium]|nr:hypothetical protein [Kiritimatiellia bacterium]
MKRLLSIFSFSTLAERPRLSRAVLLGAGILLALELAVGWGLRTGRLADGRALEQLVEGQRRTLRESRAPVWLLGNSALAYGVDPDRLAAELGRGVASLRHGSCTAAGSASMLEHYLDEAGFRPDLVALCVTKDDFNLRGYRASMSGVYRWYGRWYDLSLDRISRVSAARESLKDKARAWRKGGGGSAASAPADAGETREEGAGGTTVFEGTIDEREARWLEQLAWSFSPDWSGLDRIAARARREGFRPVLVWLPVTPEYRRF